MRRAVLKGFVQTLQNRLDCAEVDADTFDRSRSLFDVVDGLGEELDTLESSRGDAYDRGSDAERVHCNDHDTLFTEYERFGGELREHTVEGGGAAISTKMADGPQFQLGAAEGLWPIIA